MDRARLPYMHICNYRLWRWNNVITAIRICRQRSYFKGENKDSLVIGISVILKRRFQCISVPEQCTMNPG